MMDNLQQNSNIESQNNCQTDNCRTVTDLMSKVLSMAKNQGATQAEVVSGLDQGYSVDVRLSEVDKVEFSRDKNIGLTVYFGQSKGSASTSDTSDESLQQIVKAACDIAKVSAKDPCFGLADASLIAHNHPELDLYHPWDLSPDGAIQLAIECESKAMSVDKRITNSEGASVASYQFCRGFATSHGFNGLVQSSRHTVSCILIANDDKGMQRDYDYTTARVPELLISLDDLAKKAAEKTLARLNAQKIKTQTIPVLFSSEVSSTLISTFLSAISGGNLYRKNSFLLDSIGQQLFPSFMTIHEQPHLKQALGSCPYDGDGLLTRNNVIVEGGQLMQYVLDTYSARRLKLQSTANSGGVHNLTVDGTGQDFNQLVKTMDKGIIVTDLMGQGINITTGDYSRGASGFWVENGEIQYPIEEFTVAGNLKDIFQRIVAVGNDWDVRKASRCGSILIESMMVAGQ